MEEILVQIACRLDNDLLKTVNSLYSKASNPDNIEVLIINQDFEDNQWKQKDFPDKVTLINIEESKTRNLAHTRAFSHLYVKSSHKYFMNIDAHMRFDENWDETLITAHTEYTTTTGNKCMITVYPKGYKVSETGEESLPKDDTFAYNRLVAVPPDHITVEAVPVKSSNYLKYGIKFVPSVVAGGFHFTSIDWVTEVGYDIYCGWGQHETNMTLRSYCHGYDTVSYYIRPVYHLYDHTQRKSTKAPSFNYHINSAERLRSQLRGENSTFLESKFKIGDMRTVEEFETFYNFKLREAVKAL
jgi:glycosyltransferase involved in cell wall biosynthesis